MRETKIHTASTSPLREVIRRAHHGDAAAFDAIYRLHSKFVYSLCLRMLRDPFEAEDLTQETFVLVLRKIHTFRGESAFSSWLYRLATNLVLMRFRKKTPESTSLNETDEAAKGSDLSSEIGGLDPHLSGLFDRLNIQAAVDLLPAGCKTTFILHDVEGYQHKEIAGILGCSVGNSKAQLHRARTRLRKMLREPQTAVLGRHKAAWDSLALAGD